MIQAPNINKKWYAIYVKSRHEKNVFQELCDKGIKSSIPLIKQTRQWSDRKKIIDVPLFAGYVFVNINILKDKLNVLQTNGVVKFVTVCNKNVSIPDEQMYWLNRVIMSELQLESEREISLGAEVYVLYGPLKGLRGLVKQQNSKTKLVVWFDAIMQGVSVEIDPAFLSISNSKKFEMPLATRHNKSINPVQTGEYKT